MNIRAMYVLPLSPPTTPSSSSKEIEVSEIRKELLNEKKVSITNIFTLFVVTSGGANV